MYTPIVTPAELNNIYPEIITEITRNDGGALATEAIDTAIEEIKMYLTRYDMIQLFGDAANAIAASFTNAYLSRIVKDIAVWHLIQLANPNIDYEIYKHRYEEHIASLRRIQKGDADPKWPYLDTTGEAAPQGDSVSAFSNPKRNNSY